MEMKEKKTFHIFSPALKTYGEPCMHNTYFIENKTEMTFQSYAAGGTEFKKFTN